MNKVINIYIPKTGIVIEYGCIDSPFGRCLLAFNNQGLCALEFIDDNEKELISNLRARWDNEWATHNPVLDAIDFSDLLSIWEEQTLRLCLRGTPFQVKVWKTLLEIPRGQTATYTEIATMMGMPKAARAVASAIAANHLGLFIPCHRVVRNNGDTGEYRWGKERKKELLAWERVMLDEPERRKTRTQPLHPYL